MKVLNPVNLFILLLLNSCINRVSELKLETPLSSIIKLHSAEQFSEFDVAKKYIDVENVYRDSSNSSTTGELIWKELILSQNKLAKDNKFTNNFKYFDYEILETITSDKAIVYFNAKNKTSKNIVYTLYLKNKIWVINAIEYR